MPKRVCWYCGTKSEGKTCSVCDADLDAQAAESAAFDAEMQAENEAEARRYAIEEAEDALLYMARESAEAHLCAIRDELTPEAYAAEFKRLTESEYQLLLEGWRDEDETTNS